VFHLFAREGGGRGEFEKVAEKAAGCERRCRCCREADGAMCEGGFAAGNLKRRSGPTYSLSRYKWSAVSSHEAARDRNGIGYASASAFVGGRLEGRDGAVGWVVDGRWSMVVVARCGVGKAEEGKKNKYTNLDWPAPVVLGEWEMGRAGFQTGRQRQRKGL
jgi:hypothetical protein